MLCVHLPCQFVLQTMDDMIITTPPNGFHIVMPIATHHLHTDIYQYCTTNKQTSLQNDHSTLFVFVLLCQCAPLGQLATCTLHTILASTCSLKKQFASRQHSIGRFRLHGRDRLTFHRHVQPKRHQSVSLYALFLVKPFQKQLSYVRTKKRLAIQVVSLKCCEARILTMRVNISFLFLRVFY